jgi:AmpE protein
MSFLIVLLAILLLEAYSELSAVQRDSWLRKWHQGLAAIPFLAPSPATGLASFVAIPVIILHLLLSSMAHHHWGFAAFAVELLVLLYALGRGNLDRQITLITADLPPHELQAAFADAVVVNTACREGNIQTEGDPCEQAFKALPYRIFERTFVVIFWFYLFGAPAALAYRLLALHADRVLVEHRLKSADLALRWLWLLEWLPVRLLALTLGLVGNFSYALSAAKARVFCRITGTAEFLHNVVQGALGNKQSELGLSRQGVNDITAIFGRAMTCWMVVIAILVIVG